MGDEGDGVRGHEGEGEGRGLGPLRELGVDSSLGKKESFFFRRRFFFSVFFFLREQKKKRSFAKRVKESKGKNILLT